MIIFQSRNQSFFILIILSIILSLFLSIQCQRQFKIPNPTRVSFSYNETVYYADYNHGLIRIDLKDTLYLTRDNGATWFVMELDQKEKLEKQQDESNENINSAGIHTIINCNFINHALFNPSRFNWDSDGVNVPYVLSAIGHNIFNLFHENKPDNWGLNYEKNCFIIRDLSRLTWMCIHKESGIPVLYGPTKETMLPINRYISRLNDEDVDKLFRIPHHCKKYIQTKIEL